MAKTRLNIEEIEQDAILEAEEELLLEQAAEEAAEREMENGNSLNDLVDRGSVNKKQFEITDTMRVMKGPTPQINEFYNNVLVRLGITRENGLVKAETHEGGNSILIWDINQLSTNDNRKEA